MAVHINWESEQGRVGESYLFFKKRELVKKKTTTSECSKDELLYEERGAILQMIDRHFHKQRNLIPFSFLFEWDN